MASWSEVEAKAPELTELARRHFDAHVHKTIATLRKDGSPRISGTEVEFARGELWIGSMWQAVKALDLRRDSRYALHCGSDSPPDWSGDAKVAGKAEEIDDDAVKADLASEGTPSGPYHLFRCDVSELVVVRLAESRDHLSIESWHEGRGVSRIKR
jgi:pyridoxamine 5'-phosphate oxidase-like protein